ncbi:transporter [Alphaproteobacteria bacterium]|nr:transporter [Alphaproteobacteria bacterium]GHS95773.1 transporter [Alphaproteobacteria bacterium]
MFCCPSQRESFASTLDQDRILLKKTAWWTFFLTFFLIFFKYAAFATTHSLAVKASVLDSVKDCFVSSCNIFFVLKSLNHADPRYPFGAGKISALAALVQALFLLGTGGFLIVEATHTLQTPHTVSYSPWALVAFAASFFLLGFLVVIQTRAAKRTKLLAVLADSAHYKSDFIFNASTLFCLLASFKSPFLDIALGGGIALYLLLTAWRVGSSALRILLDQSLCSQDLQKIEQAVLFAEGKIKTIRAHSSGFGEFIVVEIIENSNTLTTFKEKQCAIEHSIRQQFPRAFIVVSLFVEQTQAAQQYVRRSERA